jgi:DNA repair protein RecO (recombination protein O)
MLQKTKGLVLRSVKYGETSLISTIFTESSGVQSFMVQGVRSSKSRQNRAGSFQPGTLLELVIYLQPDKNLQRIKEYQAACFYTSMHEEVIKNSIALFSIEILLRLLPEHAPLPDLFAFVYNYFTTLDHLPVKSVANFPLFFIIHCSKEFGVEPHGIYRAETPYLNLEEGGFTEHVPAVVAAITDEDSRFLDQLLRITDLGELQTIALNADIRLRLIDWYVAYLQKHTQHMGNVRSLSILRTILH